MEQSLWTPEDIAVYRRNAQRLREQDQEQERYRRETAWSAARTAAGILRERFHMTRVVVFGSLARGGSFTQWSDVDVAAWGIDPRDTLRAIGVIMDLESGVDVNLVDINTATPALLASIERDGIDI